MARSDINKRQYAQARMAQISNFGSDKSRNVSNKTLLTAIALVLSTTARIRSKDIKNL